MALFHIHEAAKSGIADAMVLYGNLHLNDTIEGARDPSSLGGHSSLWNPRTALEWFQKAIALGHPGALYYAANLYEFGTGVALNLTLAIKMYTQSAKLGYGAAQEKLEDFEELGITFSAM